MSNRAIIFDMDGVICHTNPYHSQAFRVFFSKRGLNPTEEEFAQHMYGKSNSYILSHFLQRPIRGEELKIMEDEKESLFRSIYRDHIEPISGFLPFYQSLLGQGYRTGVATSAPFANMEMILTQLGMMDQPRSLMASEDVQKHKPDPEIYLRTADRLKTDPDQCIVFEDSFSGVTAAKAAGMKVIGVLSSHSEEELPPCDRYIADYSHINNSDINQMF